MKANEIMDFSVRLKTIILSKETSYWGFLVPAMVNSIACFLYSGGSNATLGIINGMLMLFFTGCYYLFCLYYFWDKEKVKGGITYFLFITIPLVIYGILVQPLIVIENSGVDFTLTVLYYMAFYCLFCVRYEPITSKIIHYYLNWRAIYLFWAISFIVFLVLFITFINMEILAICQIYWWTLGLITTLLGVYLVYKKQWINGLLYFCLFLFPMLTFKLGRLVKELLIH